MGRSVRIDTPYSISSDAKHTDSCMFVCRYISDLFIYAKKNYFFKILSTNKYTRLLNT